MDEPPIAIASQLALDTLVVVEPPAEPPEEPPVEPPDSALARKRQVCCRHEALVVRVRGCSDNRYVEGLCDRCGLNPLVATTDSVT